MKIFNKHNLRRYLEGKGIEIGALNHPLKLNRKRCQVTYVDWLDKDTLIKHNPTIPSKDIKNPDIIASAIDLSVIADESIDFVIACQILEHLPNPIKALEEFYRVLKINGILYLAIPDKRYTFDKERPITPLSHLIEDYKKGISLENNMIHYQEWVNLVEKKRPPHLRWNLEDIISIGCAIHFHVWTPKSIVEALNYMCKNLNVRYHLEDYYYRKGESPFVFILKKAHSDSPLPNLPCQINERYSHIRVILDKIERKTKIVIRKFLKKCCTIGSN